MSTNRKKQLTREEAKSVDFLVGMAFLIVAGAIICHAVSQAEPLIATALGYFRAAGQ